ncbi:MAG: sigma-54-dependent Fis family transcriptional regulator [Myxococcaceae bacterium]|nr:sigma-54-dependent Fis family transcriptional regulator [Myxococcaceae bacterium]
MQDVVSQVVASLLAARDFEEAAVAMLRPILEIAGQELAASSYSQGRCRILRGVVHLRPGEGYRRLAVVDAGERPSTTGDGGSEEDRPLFTSASIWRAVVEHRCAVSVDVHLGQLQPHAPGVVARDEPEVGGVFHSRESQQRFLARQATHVLALPLLAPGGEIDGMAFVEADCRAAVGREFIWRGCAERLQRIAAVAVPYLNRLPLRPVAVSRADDFLPVVGAALANLMPLLRVCAQQDETLLFSGPTGTGKSRLARWCHEHSGRARGPFEVLDLMTVPEELQMGELFGWRKGAFTGAARENPGSVARAEGGSLFIDEIDKLSLKAQAGLLRLLEERTFRQLGEGQGARRADVRFIIGTNVDLHVAVRSGQFREDLYYRINVLPFVVPPLDERKDEIPGWAHYMLNRRHRERSPGGQARVSQEAERRLCASSWPGSLRQLDNIIRRAYMLALAQSGSAWEVRLEEEHVARALAYEQRRGPAPLMEAMQAAAESFFHEAQRRGEAGLALDLADAFRGLVLAVALRRLGMEEAFRLLGCEHILRGRNHQRLLHRERERVESLCEALGKESSLLAELRNDHPQSSK